MKSIVLSVLCVLATCLSGYSQIPQGAIPIIYDGHLYMKATVVDTIPVTLIYDTGADYLYLDKDYMEKSTLNKLPLHKGQAQMGGAGNSEGKKVTIIVSPINVKAGNVTHQENITPIINLRDIVGCHADGMTGNNMMLKKALMINYNDGYLLPLDVVKPEMLEGYTKLPAQFVDNRIFVDCELTIDPTQTLKGQFVLDLGCGSGVVLTNETLKTLNLEAKNKAYSFMKDSGFGGDGRDVTFRADTFKVLDSFENVVIDASLNTEGALSKRPYLGLLGNDILCHYDLIIDAQNKQIYAKRNNSEDLSYQHSSRMHMSYVNRTDTGDGWIVRCLYEDGKAQAAGIEIGDVIIAINGRAVKEMSWEEERDLKLKGTTVFTIRKSDGTIKDYTVNITDEII